jgi:enamine deaminase RidA (YjgF/YER057c/UK114 family)
MTDAKARIAELGIVLPTLFAASGSAYVPFARTGNLLFFTGQVSHDSNGGIRGVVGDDLTLEDGRQAARLSAINLLAQISRACDGELDRVKQIVKVTAFLQSAPTFEHIADVINGASDLIAAVFEDRGAHARASVGNARIPLNFTTEIDAVVEIRD